VHTFLWSFHLQFSLEQRGHVSKVNLPLSSGELLDRMDEVHELYTKWGKRRRKNCTRVNFLVKTVQG
jgi:sulfite reductase beta subunit-like hemoprotein